MEEYASDDDTRKTKNGSCANDGERSVWSVMSSGIIVRLYCSIYSGKWHSQT